MPSSLGLRRFDRWFKSYAEFSRSLPIQLVVYAKFSWSPPIRSVVQIICRVLSVSANSTGGLCQVLLVSVDSIGGSNRMSSSLGLRQFNWWFMPSSLGLHRFDRWFKSYVEFSWSSPILRLKDRVLSRSKDQTELVEVKARSSNEMKKTLNCWDLTSSHRFQHIRPHRTRGERGSGPFEMLCIGALVGWGRVDVRGAKGGHDGPRGRLCAPGMSLVCEWGGEDGRKRRVRKTEGHAEGLTLWGLFALSPAEPMARAPHGDRFREMQVSLSHLKLNTISEEAQRPNIGEFFIVYVRALDRNPSRFWAVKTSRNPTPPDPREPRNTAKVGQLREV
ncbi:lipoyl synthase, chloroplastic-like [Sesbania bispinosa]|nr:lipoyl synthase, chloroplastic-like [Sesbania bispinosa]